MQTGLNNAAKPGGDREGFPAKLGAERSSRIVSGRLRAARTSGFDTRGHALSGSVCL